MMLFALVNGVVLDQNSGFGLVFSSKSQPHRHPTDAPVSFSDNPVVQ